MEQNLQQVEEVDWFSLLPDALIHKILNRVDTKIAVQMSFFSKRWISIWITLENLTLSRHSFILWRSFSRFVCAVLSGRDNNYPIQCLNLDFGTINDHERYWHSILACVSNKNIKHLDISISAWDTVFFQRWDFTCPTLESFNLNGAGPPYIVPYFFSPLRLTSLERLHIKSIGMPSYESRMEFFSHCPILKDLTLTNCSMKGLESFGILGPELCRVRLLSNSYSQKKDAVVAIWAPKLAYFQYKGSAPPLFDTRELDSLEEIVIHVNAPRTTKMKEMAARQIILMFHKFSSTKRVVLTSDTIKVIYLEPGSLEQQVSPFQKLEHLVLRGWQQNRYQVCHEVVTNYFLRSAPGAIVTVENNETGS